ncbi:MAG: dihydrofolate reductase [Eubacterium sp.]|nr:dihydrofolate reductase [Eubacterium sp.]
MIKLIAAVAVGNVIGSNGKIPWELPEDKRVFRELTMGSVLVMGRNTYESIGRPLPGRDTIVVTSHPDSMTGTAGLFFSSSIEQALTCVRDRDVFLCGGEKIYEEGLKFAEIMYITRVELVCEGDRFFPDEDKYTDFTLTDRKRLSANCTLFTYTK